MLVINSNSTCDVCLENYSSDGVQSPHTIPCGHTFCLICLGSLRNICPLCRTGFEAENVRKLHIDRAETPPISKPDLLVVEVSQEARRYQTDITRVVKEGGQASEIRALIDQCHRWLKSQPHDQHGDLRVSFLLLYNMTEMQRRLARETETARDLRAECEALRTQCNEAEQKYAELEHRSADEKEIALAVERSLKAHYDKLNTQWQRKVSSLILCRIFKKKPSSSLMLFSAHGSGSTMNSNA